MVSNRKEYNFSFHVHSRPYNSSLPREKYEQFIKLRINKNNEFVIYSPKLTEISKELWTHNPNNSLILHMCLDALSSLG